MHYTLRDAEPKHIPFLVEMMSRTLPEVYRDIVPEADMPVRIEEVSNAIINLWPKMTVCEAAKVRGGFSWDAIFSPGGRGEAVAGFVNVINGSHISLLWVDTPYIGHGVGRRLIAHAEGTIFEAGHTEASLEVYKANERAVGFYSAFGWRTVREFIGRAGAPVLDMRKVKA